MTTPSGGHGSSDTGDDDEHGYPKLLQAERQTHRRIDQLVGEMSKLSTSVAVLSSQFVGIQETMEQRDDRIELALEKRVTQHEFYAVKLIAYGFASASLLAVCVALLALVVRSAGAK